jgi:hypothetical protein
MKYVGEYGGTVELQSQVKPKHSQKNLLQCRFVSHKFKPDWTDQGAIPAA